MAISDADWELMKQVAAYFESTRKAVDPNAKYRLKREDSRSVNDTAVHFNITRSKATKMLITTGALSTSISSDAKALRRQGMSLKEIAEELGVSVATVSSNLPYEDEIHGGDSASEHALAMREYRAYERMRKEKQVQKNKDDHERELQTMSEHMTNTRDEREDWKKDLDSKLSFTETDSRRARITYEMIQASGLRESAQAFLEENGIELPEFDLEASQKALREKLEKNGSLTPEETLLLGEFPGALYDRNRKDLEELYGERLPYEPGEMIRLHLELVADFSDTEKENMHQYGAM
ncbi:MAG: hypothetical protein IJ242_08995, partial [Clostridia bacterium]|nr:hypothetical protein [Clostridia bacterium]